MKNKVYFFLKERWRLSYLVLLMIIVISLASCFARQLQKTNQPDSILEIKPLETLTILETVENCSNSSPSGYVIYREGGNLHLSDSDGCYPQLIFEDITSSPTWSPDGKRIAVECNINGEICVLDTSLFPDQCLQPNNDRSSECRLPVLEKHNICGQNSECQVVKISWSPSMKNLAITYYYENSVEEKLQNKGSTICILSLASGLCKTIYSDETFASLWADWSPVNENKLAVSDMRGNIFLINTDGKNKQILTEGVFPSWSPDGKKIAFYKMVNEPNKPLFGIALVDTDNLNMQWVYFPPPSDEHYRNLGVGCKDKGMGGISWSPDQKKIIFAASYDSIYVCRLVRMNIETDVITFITPKTINQPPNYYYDPDWKP